MRLNVTLFGSILMAWSGLASALSLTEALERASQHDPAVGESRSRFAAESEESQQEYSELRPHVSINSQANYSYSDSQFAFGSAQDHYPSWSAYLEVRQALLRLDWSARKDRAKVYDSLATRHAKDSERDFVVRVASRYLNTLLAREAVEESRSEVKSVQESLKATRQRFDVGLVPGTDLKEAMARADLAKARLVSAQAELEDQQDALDEVTGTPGDAPNLMRDDAVLPATQPLDVESWARLARENGTATQSALLDLELARTELESRRAEVLPEIDLVAQAGRNESTEYILGQRQDDAQISLQLSIPIYAGGLGQSRIRQAQAKVDEAEFRLLQVERAAERDVRKLHRSVNTARAEAQAYSRALESAIAAQKATQAGYDAGSRTITDVLDAARRVVQARRNRNASRYSTLINLLTLHAEAGLLTAQVVSDLDYLFETP
tara:strand:- start:822 stop:2135 length:1314 start_codon:yes stop_codon:yes gene_type:complete